MQNRHPCKICKTDALAKYAKQTPLQNMQNRHPCKICKTDTLAKYAKQTPLQNMQNRHPCKICKTDTLAKYAKQTPLQNMQNRHPFTNKWLELGKILSLKSIAYFKEKIRCLVVLFVRGIVLMYSSCV
jgi:hypothetical protein